MRLIRAKRDAVIAVQFATDHLTGSQYLSAGSVLTPRLDADGKRRAGSKVVMELKLKPCAQSVARIIGVAIRTKSGRVYSQTKSSHAMLIDFVRSDTAEKFRGDLESAEQGFMMDDGTFVTQLEASKMANDRGQKPIQWSLCPLSRCVPRAA